jgi:SpoVK/Ycf46/Vps4 family AAA+-type ATPase
MRDVVVQLLAELDSFGTRNEGVFALAATNHPWDVDTALRRPGRFDRTLLVLPPDERAREAILRYHLRERPLADDVDCAGLASRTRHYSGADLAHVCETATERALADSIDIGIARAITQNDLLSALREVTPSITEWLATAKNYAQFANEGGQYDELLEFLREEGLA